MQREAPIHISNLLPYDPKADKGSRVRFEVERDQDGKVMSKKRVCVRSGAVLNTVSRSEKTT